MIFRNIANSYQRLSCGRIMRFGWGFASGEKLLHVTKKLAYMDSLELEKLCESTLEGYRRPGDEEGKKERTRGRGKSPDGRDTKEKEKELSKTDGEETTLSQDIIFLYNTLSDAKVGFLKGDIHSDLIFKLNKYLSQKNPKQLPKEVTAQQLKKFLNHVTDVKQFRLPKKGVKNSEHEDKKNMYERQILLQIVSNQLSTQRYDDVLDSLTKLDKLHLTSAFRSYIVEWFRPLCSAIHEEQNKCRDQKNLSGSRKIYAQDFLKLAPERLALVCLSELLKQITSILYKDFIRDDPKDHLHQQQRQKEPEFDQYDSIRFKTLCLSLARWVSVQSHYEQQERQFKMVMKLYDSINMSKKQQKEDLMQRRKQELGKQKLTVQSQGENGENQDQPVVNPLDQQQKSMKEAYEAKIKEIQQTYNQRYVTPEDRKKYLQELSSKLLKQHYKYKSQMSEEVQFQIGEVLIYMMKQIIKTQNKSGYKVPLLTLQHKYIKRANEVIYDKRLKVNDHFLNTVLPIIEKDGDLFLHLDRSVPTMVPPMPWVEYEIGGYYQYPSTFMRFSDCKVQERLIKYSDLSRVFTVLNQLARTPWKINNKVLEVVETLWVEGGKVGEIPKRYSQMISTYLTKLKGQTNYQKKKQLLKQIQILRDQHSLRSDFGLKLSMARAFGKLDRFFYPHNVDFRGRVYPIPPHLNHIGNDLSRGLLMFADGRRLGKSGVKWLKIHSANLMGKDKATIPEKLEFISANLALIHAIASDPLKNREWIDNQDCWQSLGAIFQLSAALKLQNPEDYVSCLHIHQDGSCNGLQHYAALGRDTEGAYQVNLGPTERPGDVYTHVANMVIRMIDDDIATPSSKNHELAKKLRGQIKRKTIKQTVMTSVYGVTFIGAREQIFRQLKDQHFLKNDDEQYAASIYVAKLTLQAISNLFSSAHLIKKWLIDCARVVSNAGNPMGWITPMGLPVVQPYRKQSSLDMVNTIVQTLKLAKRSENLPVNKNKQKSAFPPNYVHSLDSTHMMYTAEQCVKEGVTFAAVHDSYWTHAATVEQMNQILREQFIRLHSEPLLENLKRSLENRYPNLEFPDIPQRGDFNLQKIKESTYFFS